MIRLKCVDGKIIDLNASSLAHARIEDLDLRNLLVRGQSFRASEFSRTNLRSAIVDLCNFEACSFIECELINCNVRGADLRGACFRNSSLIGADFRWSNFSDTTFEDSDIAFASFECCWLIGADFGKAIRTASASFTGAIVDDSTRWPVGFFPKDVDFFRDLDGHPWH